MPSTQKPCRICEATMTSGQLYCSDCKHCYICRAPKSKNCDCFEICLCQVCGRELDTLREDPENNTYCKRCDDDADCSSDEGSSSSLLDNEPPTKEPSKPIVKAERKRDLSPKRSSKSVKNKKPVKSTHYKPKKSTKHSIKGKSSQKTARPVITFTFCLGGDHN